MGMVALSSKNSIIVTLEIFKKPNPNFRRVIMITNAKDFYASIQGKRVAFCGIGGSNLPLISIFQKKGAVVLACDKRDREKAWRNGRKAGEPGGRASSWRSLFEKFKCGYYFPHAGYALLSAGTGTG